MRLETTQAPPDIHHLIRGHFVACTGQLAALTREQFIQIVEEHGGRYTRGLSLGRGVALLVVGQRQLPISRQGQLTSQLRRVRVLEREGQSRLTILTEQQFLENLGLNHQREQVSPLLTTSTLCELLGVSRQRIRAWVQAGLVRPFTVSNGVWHFDFQQVAAAKTLCDLTRAGVTTGRIRRSLEQLQRWLPQMDQALQQLSVLEHNQSLVVRLEDGEVVGTDGQLQFNFDGSDDPPCLPLRIDAAPRTARQWIEQGQEQEAAGYLEDAADSYREALRLGGPDADLCFDLANVLHQLGHRQQALERYHQVLEIDPKHIDAWNNLGLVLCELDRPEEACSAFRRALEAEPANERAHYNLADTLDELGYLAEAVPHWEAYLRADNASPWAAHARRRLTMA
jgi:DNA-binding transcriptional MerR regulator